ncbi:uncharacterized protein LOC131940868 isoform X1 [Physella acuta]|uniref:uncharacterized protein LOC131940868 isoform X1 n=1 Tax=Physella acuta TaxID=109671 RepID=UPI0027DB37F3|nr:uncharacterized protein LOC131940868 isoform X1 [Physella acuta]
MEIAGVSQAFLLSTLFLLTGFIHVCDCANCTNPQEQVARCFTDNRLTFPANMEVDSATSLSYVNEQLCRQPDDAAKALSCFLQYAIDCTNASIPNLAGYLPSPNKTKELVTITCRNFTLFNQTCTNSQSSKISSCVQPKVEEIAKSSGSDYGKIMCKKYEATYSCMRPTLGLCGCATYQVMEETIKGPLWPALCSQPQFDSYHCDPNNPNVFLDSGSQMVPSLLLLLIIILTILFF